MPVSEAVMDFVSAADQLTNSLMTDVPSSPAAQRRLRDRIEREMATYDQARLALIGDENVGAPEDDDKPLE